jgi:hypothetical protein
VTVVVIVLAGSVTVLTDPSAAPVASWVTVTKEIRNLSSHVSRIEEKIEPRPFRIELEWD